MIPWTTDEAIHRIVKRDIPTSERGTIATLNDMPDWMVEEARAIARQSIIGALRYLRFYVARQYASRAEDFVEDVLLKAQDARTWKVQDCIYIPWPPISTSTIDVQHYIDTLKDIEGERWFRIKHRSADRLSDCTPGMIGVVQRNSRYWHVAPPGSDRYPVARPDDIEVVPLNQLRGSIRRWMAHRLAWWARQYLEQYRSTPAEITGDGILGTVPDIDMSRVTSDARIAAEALAREAHAYGDSLDFPRQAGFLGPDEWYQSSPATYQPSLLDEDP